MPDRTGFQPLSREKRMEAYLATLRAHPDARDLAVLLVDAEQRERQLLARVEELEQRVRELREALVRLEEPCPDCDGGGCEWCGLTGFVFRDSSEMQEIRRAALAAVPPEPAANP